MGPARPTGMSTNPTAPLSPLRRLALLALGLLVVLTGVGLGSSPASALPPSAPQKIFAVGYDDYIRVHWAPPLTSNEPILSYRIERVANGKGLPPKVWVQDTTAPLVDTTAVQGTSYIYRVRATSTDGDSAFSDFMLAHIQNDKTEYSPAFGADVDAFVARQYQDLLGRDPSGSEQQTAVLNILKGTWTTADLIDLLVAKPERAHRHQIIRLYNAYFDRTADHAGLAYWSDQITEKAKSINTVSSSFAASAEFKTMYGNLTNAEFVTLVYQNVLDRSPSNADHAYWKGQLDQGKVNRGRLMTLFSESAEYKAISRGIVAIADVHDALLGAKAEDATLALWGAHVQGGGTGGGYGTTLLFHPGY